MFRWRVIVASGLISLLLLCTCSKDAPTAPDGTAQSFTFRPDIFLDQRFPCSDAQANQMCYERDFERSTSHQCESISGTSYLTSITCWKP